MKPGFLLVLAALSSLALAVSASSIPSPLGDIQLGVHEMPDIQAPPAPSGIPTSSLPVFVRPSAASIPDLSAVFGQQSSVLQQRLGTIKVRNGVFADGKLDLSSYLKLPRIGPAPPGPASSPQELSLIHSDSMKSIKSGASPGNWQNAWSGWQ